MSRVVKENEAAVALFGRSARKKRAAQDEAGLDRANAPESGSSASPQAHTDGPAEPESASSGSAVGRGVTTGPWDVSEAPEIGNKVDLGSIWLPGIHDMKLRMEIDKRTQIITGTALVSEGSALQVQAFAAPRTEGIWNEIREEIASSLTAQGATVDEIVGTFGRELLAQVPATDSEGKKARRIVRFIGVDGPRWFLRGVITGRAASDGEAAKPIEELFSNVTVLRDPSPRAPRDVLPLTVPRGGPVRKDEPDADSQKPGFNPLKRGPEITEIR